VATATVTDHDVDALNQLLRGEISAVETYDQAIEKLAGKPVASRLGRFRDDHAHAVTTLRNEVGQRGGEPTTTSGSWGTFAGAVTGAAKLLGPETVLATLKKGEEHGISEYEEALAKDGVSDSCKTMFRTQLLAKCREHAAELDGLIASNA